MKTRVLGFVFLASLIAAQTLAAQCSDAGVCTLSHRAPERHVVAGIDYVLGRSGKADDITYHSLLLSGSVPLFEESQLHVQIPISHQVGPLGSVTGIGDLTVVWSQALLAEAEFVVRGSIGAKIALADVNRGGLPQPYQSGLGTNDALLGIALETDQWNFSLGYQLSRGRNDKVLTELKRGDDLLLSGGYTTLIDLLTVKAELLAIKRLHRSSVVDFRTASPPRTYLDVPSSDQSQINVLITALYPLNEGIHARVMAAVPLLKRDVNVDGLTRSLTLSVGLQADLWAP